MPTDDERREVARALREKAAGLRLFPSEQTTMRAYEELVGCVCRDGDRPTSVQGFLRLMADLIEPVEPDIS